MAICPFGVISVGRHLLEIMNQQRQGLHIVETASGLGPACTQMVHAPRTQRCLQPFWSCNMFRPTGSQSFLLCIVFVFNQFFFSFVPLFIVLTDTDSGRLGLWAGLSSARDWFSEQENLVTPHTLHHQGPLPSPFSFLPVFLPFLQPSGCSVVFAAASIVVPTIAGLSSKYESWDSRSPVWAPLLLC